MIAVFRVSPAYEKKSVRKYQDSSRCVDVFANKLLLFDSSVRLFCQHS